MKISAVWDSIYSRRMIEQYAMRFPTYVYEDITWFIATLTSAKRITHVHEAFYTYRIARSGSTLHSISKHTQQEQLQGCFQTYIDCIQYLSYKKYLDIYADTFYTFITDFFYSARGKTFAEYTYFLTYIRRYCSYPIYRILYRKIQKRRITRCLQYCFSIQKDRAYRRRTITICGYKVHIPIKYNT